jgi:hypothetical protein
MAEIKQENIVYNLTTQKNELTGELDKSAKAVQSLDTEINETGKDAEKVFDRMAKTAKAYGERLKEAEREQKRLSSTITEQTRIVNDQRKELLRVEERLKKVGQNTVEYQKLTRESIKLKEAIKDTGIALQGLRIDQRQTTANVNELKKLRTEAEKTELALKKSSGSATEFGSALSNVNPQIGAVSNSLKNALGFLSKFGVVGASAAAAIGAIAFGFKAAKDTVQVFADELTIRQAGIRSFAQVIKDEFGAAFADLFTGGFENAINRLDGILGLTAVGKAKQRILLAQAELARVAREQIEREDIQLQTFRIKNIVELSRLEREQSEKLREFEEQRTQTGRKNLELLNEAEAAIRKEFEIRLKIQEKENELTIRRNRLSFSGRFEAEVQAQNEAKLNQLLAQQEDAIRSIDRRRRERIATTKEEVTVELGLIGKLNKELAELNKLRSEAFDEDTIISIDLQIRDKQKQISDLEATIKEIIAIVADGIALEINPLESILKINAENVLPAETQREINKKIKELSNQLGTTQLGTERFREINSEIERLRRLLQSNLADTPINNAVLGIQDAFKRFNADNAGNQGASIIDPDRIRDEAQQAVQIFSDFSRQILAEDIARKDRQIDLQRDRLNEFRRLAEQGNAEQLQLEEERLNKLLEARERSAQRERQIASLQIASANAVAIAEGIKNVISGFKDPVSGIANAIALAATVGSTILAIRNSIGQIPAFAEGTEYVKLNGAPKGKDTVMARLDEGERVLTKRQNKQLKGISNEKLVQLANDYKYNNLRVSKTDSTSNKLDLTSLEFGINRTNRLLESLSIVADVNEYGLSAGISRVKKRIDNRRKIAR